MVRIDRIYTPDLPDTLLTSKIQWDLFDSDHAAVIYEYAPSTEIERGHDLKRIDTSLIIEPQIQKTLNEIIQEEQIPWNEKKRSSADTLKSIKHRVRAFLMKQTKVRKKAQGMVKKDFNYN